MLTISLVEPKHTLRPTVTTKVCATCKVAKPRDKFHKATRTKDGLNFYCKECQAVKAKAYGEAKRAPLKAARAEAARKVYDQATGLRECTGCKVSKPMDDFPRRRRAAMGRERRCKRCVLAWERQHTKVRLKADPLYHRRQTLLRSWGLSVEAYDALVAAQGGGCAVCGAIKSSHRKWRLQVDHDHVTGKLRGILCNRCNTALGMVNDDCALLEKLITYVKSHAVQP